MTRGSKQHAQTSARTQRPRLRVLLGEAVAIGPGKADLLEAIRDEGSISKAARAMGMSYRRAWLLVDTMNKAFKLPLVAPERGGAGGGGARITETGEDVLARYRRMEEHARAAVEKDIAAFGELLDCGPPKD